MRYHFFLHYGWFLQNLRKEALPSFMHTTVLRCFAACPRAKVFMGAYKGRIQMAGQPRAAKSRLPEWPLIPCSVSSLDQVSQKHLWSYKGPWTIEWVGYL